MRLTKAQQHERDQALEYLRKHLPTGAKVLTVVTHVAASGMTRWIVPIITVDGAPEDVSWAVARAVGWKLGPNHDGVEVKGAGMNMCFHLVYTLSHALYPNGHPCLGTDGEWDKRCPSNDHTNHPRDTFTHHDQGGYALRYR